MNNNLKSMESKLNLIEWSSDRDKNIFIGWLVFSQFSDKIISPYLIMNIANDIEHISSIVKSLVIPSELVFTKGTSESKFRKIMSDNFKPFMFNSFSNDDCIRIGHFKGMYNSSGSHVNQFRKTYYLNSSGVFINPNLNKSVKWFDERYIAIKVNSSSSEIKFTEDEINELEVFNSELIINKFKNLRYDINKLLSHNVKDMMLCDNMSAFIAGYCLFKNIEKIDDAVIRDFY